MPQRRGDTSVRHRRAPHPSSSADVAANDILANGSALGRRSTSLPGHSDENRIVISWPPGTGPDRSGICCPCHSQGDPVTSNINAGAPSRNTSHFCGPPRPSYAATQNTSRASHGSSGTSIFASDRTAHRPHASRGSQPAG